MIEIFDNVLDKDNARYIHNCVDALSWNFVYQPTTHLLNKHWYNNANATLARGPAQLARPGPTWPDQLFKDIVDTLELRGIDSIKSQYCLGHTFGLEQQSHYDACDLTMIYYPRLDWNPDWGGGTLVGDTLVSYEGNRLLMFSCDQMHQGPPISKQCYELRSIVVYQCYAESAMIERVTWKTT